MAYYKRETIDERNKSPLISLRRNNNNVKRMLYSYVKAGDDVLEIAGGRGGDLFKLNKRRPHSVLFTDIDVDGIEEAQRRYACLRPTSFFMSAKVADFTEDQTRLIATFYHFHVVSIQFAFHYFAHDFETIFGNIDCSMRPGGTLLMTLMDGTAVRKMDSFQCDGFSMRCSDDGRTVHIRYESFNEEREELIVDHGENIGRFREKGYELVTSEMFPMHKSLSADERRITSLYRFVVLKKLTE